MTIFCFQLVELLISCIYIYNYLFYTTIMVSDKCEKLVLYIQWKIQFYVFYEKLFYLFVWICEYVLLCMGVHRPKGWPGTLGEELTGCCKSPKVCVGNQTLVLWKTARSLSKLFGPKFYLFQPFSPSVFKAIVIL